jgi:hypothetical protein
MKNAFFWDFTQNALVRTDISEERIASIMSKTNRFAALEYFDAEAEINKI